MEESTAEEEPIYGGPSLLIIQRTIVLCVCGNDRMKPAKDALEPPFDGHVFSCVVLI